MTVKIGVVLVMASLVGSAGAEELAERKQAAMEATQGFVTKLGGAMKKTMKAEGPVGAVKVCSELAPQYTADISRETGWKVTRVGTRVRNPMLGMPDAWEQDVLAQFQARKDKGEALDKMAFAEVVTEPNGKYYRFMKAIGVKPPCLTCHGSEADMNEEVKAILAERYPKDQAVGYQVGDLRGAVSIKQPIH